MPAGELEADFRRLHLHPLVGRDLAVGPDEAAFLDDPDVVHLAAHRTSQRRHDRVGVPVNRQARALAVDLEVDRDTVDRARLIKGRVEDFEERIALFAPPDPAQRFVLVVGLAVDVRVAAAAPLVDRARPPQSPDDVRAGEVEPVESALLDPVAEQGLTVPLRRVWGALEVAAAARIAAAELEVRPGDRPADHFRSWRRN